MSKRTDKILKQRADNYLNFLKKNDFSTSSTAWFATQTYLRQPYADDLNKKNAVRFDVDQENKKIAFATLLGLSVILPYSDIIRCELAVDGHSDYTRLPFSERSAPYVTFYNIRVYTKNLNMPLVDVPLLWGKTFTSHMDYKNADTFAHQVIAFLGAICAS